jgi:hypothetical protein
VRTEADAYIDQSEQWPEEMKNVLVLMVFEGTCGDR